MRLILVILLSLTACQPKPYRSLDRAEAQQMYAHLYTPESQRRMLGGQPFDYLHK